LLLRKLNLAGDVLETDLIEDPAYPLLRDLTMLRPVLIAS